MKMFVESLIGKEIKKLQSWDNLSSAQVCTIPAVHGYTRQNERMDVHFNVACRLIEKLFFT